MKIAAPCSCGLIVLMAASVPALAQDRPLLEPTRDAAVVYQISPPKGAPPRQIKMRFSATLKKIRLDAADGNFLIFDRAAHNATMVVPTQHMAMIMPAIEPFLGALAYLRNVTFTRLGSDTVAGQACMRWRFIIGKQTSQGCVTADGLLLRIVNQNDRPVMIALSVVYQSQDPALFTVPEGYRTVTVPVRPGPLPLAPPKNQ